MTARDFRVGPWHDAIPEGVALDPAFAPTLVLGERRPQPTMSSRADPDPDATRADASAWAQTEIASHSRSNGAPAPGEAKPHTLPGSAGDDKELAAATVGRYRISGRLGRGGMASVFKAHDPQIGRDVAIKFLHANLAQDADCRMRFLREARAAGGLAHPNIVVVHDVGEIDGRPYMAMELLPGRTLSEELEGGRTLPIRDVVGIGIQLGKALAYAHDHGVVHRDIKPGNIMRDAASRSVKVTDFGIAHVEEMGAGEQRTRVGDVIGTPQYMSPEQARGDKLDGRSDLFSVGIVMYQMLTGHRPFRGENLVAIATKIVNEQPKPVHELRKDVPASLRRVVERCLAKDPAQRFQSGRELAEALVKIRSEIDEKTREAARPRIVPLRVKWAAAMAIFVALVMGATATLISYKQQAAMMAQVTDTAASLARFIAAQNAAAVLGEDWDSVDVAVQEMMKTGNFERLAVVDRAGVVRASSLPAQVGQPFQPPAAEALASPGRGMVASRYLAGGEPVLGFEAPINWQDTRVGQVFLGVAEKPLAQVVRLSNTLMGVLALVTVAAVAVATWLLVNWFAKPVRLLSDSMAEIAKGRFGYRIAEQRNDEFGQLFKDFDAMAQALQDRSGGGEGSRPGSSTSPTMTRSAAAPPRQG